METKEDIFNEAYYKFLSECEESFNIYEIDYKGKGISLNDFYSSSHWRTRHNIKTKFKPLFKGLIREVLEYKSIKKFALVFEYNSRHDTDNVTGTEKLFVDALKEDKSGDGWVIDDAKKYYKMYLVKPNEELEKNTFRFKLIDLTDGD